MSANEELQADYATMGRESDLPLHLLDGNLAGDGTLETELARARIAELEASLARKDEAIEQLCEGRNDWRNAWYMEETARRHAEARVAELEAALAQAVPDAS